MTLPSLRCSTPGCPSARPAVASSAGLPTSRPGRLERCLLVLGVLALVVDAGIAVGYGLG